MTHTLRDATINDMPDVLQLIQELADYEKRPKEVEITADILKNDFSHKKFEIILAVAGENGQILGPTLYLEDLIVKESHRGKGIGTDLLNATIKMAKTRNVQRLEWQCLDWNQPALDFYKKLNANLDPEWINVVLTGTQLQAIELL